MNRAWTMKTAIEQLELCDFHCDGGPLTSNDAFIWLKKEGSEMDKTCGWYRASDDCDFWETSCGKAWQLNEGTPEENEMNFCPYCGKPIDQMPDEEEAP